MGNWCPRIKKKCRKDCVHYRSGIRYYEDNKEPVPFEDCAINIAVDCLENLVSRSIGQQKVMEQIRNEVAKMRTLFEVAFTGKVLEKQNKEQDNDTKGIRNIPK